MAVPQYAILRFAKYKGPEISGIEAHNERTKEKYEYETHNYCINTKTAINTKECAAFMEFLLFFGETFGSFGFSCKFVNSVYLFLYHCILRFVSLYLHIIINIIIYYITSAHLLSRQQG